MPVEGELEGRWFGHGLEHNLSITISRTTGDEGDDRYRLDFDGSPYQGFLELAADDTGESDLRALIDLHGWQTAPTRSGEAA